MEKNLFRVIICSFKSFCHTLVSLKVLFWLKTILSKAIVSKLQNMKTASRFPQHQIVHTYTGIYLCTVVTNTQRSWDHRLTNPHIYSTHQLSLSACCPAPSRPPLLAIRANLPAGKALVLAIHRAALWINVLLPWHQVLVALGSPFGWLAHDCLS